MTAAASVRFATSSASRMVATCAFVVPSAMPSASQISRFVRPFAIRSSTSSWRGVTAAARSRRLSVAGDEAGAAAVEVARTSGRQVHATGQDESQRGERDGRARRLGNESRGAPVDGGADVGVPLRGRHDHHRKRRKALAQHAERGEPVHAGHSEVQEDEIQDPARSLSLEQRLDLRLHVRR